MGVTHPALPDSCIVRLHRLHLRPCGGASWFLTRWGGRSMIAVHRPALDAIRLMDGRRSLGDVRLALAAAAGVATAPNLAPLLSVLRSANLIKRIDRSRVSTRELSAGTLSRFAYRFYVSPVLQDAVKRALPMHWIPRGLSWVKAFESRQRVADKRRAAVGHIASVFQHRSPAFIRSAQRGHLAYLSRTKLDPEMLAHCRPRTVDRWIERHIALEGLDHLRATLTHAPSAIVALCHMNRFTLGPLALMRRGFRVCLIYNLQASETVQNRLAFYERFRDLPGYGTMEIIGNFNYENVRRVMQLMDAGYVLVGCPDAAPPPDVVVDRSRFFGYKYSGLPQNTIRVPLQHITVSGWVWYFWLAAFTGMPMLPAVMRPRGRHSRLIIAPPIPMPAEGPVRTRTEHLARAFYRFWAAQLSEDPTQWFGWHKFDSWRPEPAESDAPRASSAVPMDAARDAMPSG